MQSLALFVALLVLSPAFAARMPDSGVEKIDTKTGNRYSVRLRTGNSEYGCTGTLLAPDIVLTAAHCLSFGIGRGSFLVALTGASFQRVKGIRVSAPKPLDTPRARTDFAAHATTRDVASDIALIQLEEPIQAAANLPFPQLPNAEDCADLPRLFAGREAYVQVYLSDERDNPWQTTNDDPSAYKVSDLVLSLREGYSTMPIYKPNFSLSDLFSGKHEKRGLQILKGDSGSGLFTDSSHGTLVIGVQSSIDKESTISYLVDLCGRDSFPWSHNPNFVEP